MDTFQCEYVQHYRMTETAHFVLNSHLKEHLKNLPPEEKLKYRTATGKPFIGIKVRVVDENEQDVKQDGEEVGEIIVKGDSVGPGCWNLPEENAKVFKNGCCIQGT
jgi:acyl-CoA synthetase (AMP-forming)/AMP-acid ligase II